MISFFSSLISFIDQKKHGFFIAGAFLLWCIAFWPFLSGEYALVEDSFSYYQHIGFYAEQLGRGVYPLWDPQWFHGAPYTFFLRRIGEVNPIYLFVVGLHKLGVHHFYAYRIFVAVYYFLACIGIYRIAFNLIKSKFSAAVAFILFLFSCFSFHLFNDYIVILLTPLVWFFAFLISFYQKESKSSFLGIILTVIIFVTTYIPFLTLTILSVFLFMVLLVTPDIFFEFCKKTFRFFRKHPILSIFSILALLYSFTPGIELYMQSKGEDARFALPGRNKDASTESVFGYSKSLVKGGDIITHGRFENMIGSYDQLNLDDIYYPIWGGIIFLLGFFSKTNRRQIVLTGFMVLLILIAMTTATPIYAFLDRHVFFIQFFRQLHYFFWIVCLPVMSLLLAEQCVQVRAWHPTDRWSRWFLNGFVIILHVFCFVFLMQQPSWLWTQQVTVILSLVFFLIHFNQFKKWHIKKWSLLLVLVMVVLPMFQIVHHLKPNSIKANEKKLSYQPYQLNFIFNKNTHLKNVNDVDVYVDYINRKADLHYASSGFAFIKKQLPGPILEKYLQHKVIIYDNIQYIDFDHATIDRVAGAFENNINVGFVFDPEQQGRYQTLSKTSKNSPLFINESSSQVTLKDFDLNHAVFETQFNHPKLLVYNDSYDKKWKVFIDGNEVELLHTNLAFKGVIVPEGNHIVRFQLGSSLEYLWRISVVLVCWVVFVLLICFSIKEFRRET